MKIAKRGPVLVKLSNGNQLDLWYDPNIRLWTLQLKDSEGNQIGPGHDGTAAHHHSREDAVAELKELADAVNKEPTMNDQQKLEVAKQALIDLKEAAEYRLRKGPDSGDQNTVRIATEALQKLAR